MKDIRLRRKKGETEGQKCLNNLWHISLLLGATDWNSLANEKDDIRHALNNIYSYIYHKMQESNMIEAIKLENNDLQKENEELRAKLRNKNWLF